MRGDRPVELRDLIRDVADFPKPGVAFKDITPLLADAAAFATVVDRLCEPFIEARVDKVLAIEARGFIVAAPVAYRLNAGLVPVRKRGKLPWRVHSERYDLEYGSDHLEIHQDALAEGDTVVIVDDVLATGGTAATAAVLAERLGGKIAGIGTILELSFLKGRERLAGYEVFTLIAY